jgi:hypothetical protein
LCIRLARLRTPAEKSNVIATLVTGSGAVSLRLSGPAVRRHGNQGFRFRLRSLAQLGERHDGRRRVRQNPLPEAQGLQIPTPRSLVSVTQDRELCAVRILPATTRDIGDRRASRHGPNFRLDAGFLPERRHLARIDVDRFDDPTYGKVLQKSQGPS